jgi:hypothetical protein
MTLPDSKLDSSKFYFCSNLKTNTAVICYVGYIMLQARGPYVNNGLDISQKKVVYLAG